MKHLRTVSRIPIHAEEQVSDLASLISILEFVLALFTAFTSGANTVFTGVVTALNTKTSEKAGTGN